jgi:hypothetical protein
MIGLVHDTILPNMEFFSGYELWRFAFTTFPVSTALKCPGRCEVGLSLLI